MRSMLISRQREANKTASSFSLNVTLSQHGWKPHMNPLDAEKALKGHPAYTYLLYPCGERTGFAFAFVMPNGQVKHDHCRIIDAKLGLFRNCGPTHVGALDKVLRDMMHCSMLEGRPL